MQAILLCHKSSKRGRRSELGQKKKMYLWKQGLASEGEHRTASRTCREETKKAKAQLELMQVSVVSDNKKRFFMHVNSKRSLEKNTGLLLDADGHLTNKDKEKVEALNAFFVLVLNSTNGSWAAQSSDLEDHAWGSSDLCSLKLYGIGCIS